MTESHNLIYTPQKKIPIGEPVILPNGSHGISFKWKHGKNAVTETVPLDTLHELVAQGKNKTSGQRSP